MAPVPLVPADAPTSAVTVASAPEHVRKLLCAAQRNSKANVNECTAGASLPMGPPGGDQNTPPQVAFTPPRASEEADEDPTCALNA